VKGRGVPSGYVEGLNEARTPPADFFSILLDDIVPSGTYPIRETMGRIDIHQTWGFMFHMGRESRPYAASNSRQRATNRPDDKRGK